MLLLLTAVNISLLSQSCCWLLTGHQKKLRLDTMVSVVQGLRGMSSRSITVSVYYYYIILYIIISSNLVCLSRLRHQFVRRLMSEASGGVSTATFTVNEMFIAKFNRIQLKNRIE